MFAFFDLLGFSNRVRAITTDQQLSDLDRDVRLVQDEFGHKSADKTIKKMHRIMQKRVLAFSDCVVVSMGLGSDLAKSQGIFDVLMSELDSFALAQGACVVNDIFIRGGVDLGYFFQRKDTLISPAMVNAYELEKSACVPMIAITPALKKYLSSHPYRKFYSDDPTKKVIKQKRGLPNGKTQWFINYLPLCLESVGPNLNEKEYAAYQKLDQDKKNEMLTRLNNKACMEWAKRHGEAIISAHAATNILEVQLKYEWLAKYHNQEMKAFFGSAANTLLVKL